MSITLPSPQGCVPAVGQDLCVSVPRAGDRPGLVLTGELDLASAPVFSAAAAAVCRDHAEPGASFLLDLSGLTFVDSAGVYSLREVRAKVVARGWAVHVRPPLARGPSRFLAFATAQGWLPPDRSPARPESSPIGRDFR